MEIATSMYITLQVPLLSQPVHVAVVVSLGCIPGAQLPAWLDLHLK